MLVRRVSIRGCSFDKQNKDNILTNILWPNMVSLIQFPDGPHSLNPIRNSVGQATLKILLLTFHHMYPNHVNSPLTSSGLVDLLLCISIQKKSTAFWFYRKGFIIEVACFHMCTCRKLMAINIRLYEPIPPVKTSFRSLCSRNCFRTKIRGGRTVYFYKTERWMFKTSKINDICV